MANFNVIVCDIDSHNELVAELYIADVFIGLISWELPEQEMKVEFSVMEPGGVFRLIDVVGVLELGMERMRELGPPGTRRDPER